MTSEHAPASSVRALPGATAIRMVATREISTRVRTKSFLIGNGIVLAVIAGGLILSAVLQGHFGKPPRVALVGPAAALSAPLQEAGKALDYKVDLQTSTSAARARQQVADGDLKVAVVPSGTGFVAVTDKRLAPGLQNVLTAGIKQYAVGAALAKQHVDPARLAAAAAAVTLTVDAIDPPKQDADERTALAYAAVLLLYMQLLSNGIAVAGSVVEEKTSRVVELLLLTIKPVQLLVGKILGVGAVGLLQLASYAVVGLGVGSATGAVTLSTAAVSTFAGTLGWYVLGFAFLGVLYAAAGSLVSRQEEIGSTTGPLSFLVIAMFAAAQASVQNPDSTFASVMSWIPPFSSILMPLRIAAGVTSIAQVVGTVALMLLTSAGLAVLCGKVYERSILRMGSRVKWKQVFSRAG